MEEWIEKEREREREKGRDGMTMVMDDGGKKEHA